MTQTTETETDTKAHAHAYAERGFGVFPLHSMRTPYRCTCGELFHPKTHRDTGKHPDGEQARNGHLNATTDRGQIEAWSWEARNIGIRLPAGVVAWDVDPRHDGDKTWELAPDE